MCQPKDIFHQLSITQISIIGTLFYICFKKGKLKNMCVNNNNNFKKLHYQTFITIFTNSSVLKFVYADF